MPSPRCCGARVGRFWTKSGDSGFADGDGGVCQRGGVLLDQVASLVEGGAHVVAELVDRGLTTVPTPKRPAKAPGLSTVQKMLSNPYYKGEVHYKGSCYDGLHEPLVSPEVWYRVQNVLAAHQVSGEKTQTHDHYLKGTVYCGTCGSRLIFTNARNRHGIVYPYFICAGRHSRRTPCTRQAMPVTWVEDRIEEHYRQVQIPEHVATALRHTLTVELDRLHAAAKDEHRVLGAERASLLDERRSLLHAHHAGAVPLDLLKEEQERIARRLGSIESRLEAGQVEYDQAKAHLDDCLALAANMHTRLQHRRHPAPHRQPSLLRTHLRGPRPTL